MLLDQVVFQQLVVGRLERTDETHLGADDDDSGKVLNSRGVLVEDVVVVGGNVAATVGIFAGSVLINA